MRSPSPHDDPSGVSSGRPPVEALKEAGIVWGSRLAKSQRPTPPHHFLTHPTLLTLLTGFTNTP